MTQYLSPYSTILQPPSFNLLLASSNAYTKDEYFDFSMPIRQ